jgi:dTDP-4-amino-4,6-dideoxygalactose transaminase
VASICCSFIDRDKLQAYLFEKGIHTMIHYPIPPHKQEAYRDWSNMSYPVSEKIHREVLSLPMSPTLEDYQIERVAEAVNGFK